MDAAIETQLFAGMPEPAVVADRGWRVIYANDAALALFRQCGGATLGNSVFAVLSDRADGPFERSCRAARQIGANVALTAYAELAAAQRFHLAGSGSRTQCDIRRRWSPAR